MSRKTYYTKFGRPYWLLPLRNPKRNGEEIRGVTECYLRFGGNVYKVSVTKAIDKDFSGWLKLEKIKGTKAWYGGKNSRYVKKHTYSNYRRNYFQPP